MRRRNGGGNKGKQEVTHEATIREENILKREIQIIMV